MSRRVSTAGMYLAYAVETVAGERPTANYVVIPEVKGLPSTNQTPPTLDTTDLSALEYKTSIPDLKELGVLDYSANLTDDLIDAWGEVCSAYETAAAAGLSLWFTHVHPKLKEAIFYPGEPSPLRWDGASVSSVASTTLYVTATGPVESGDKPTLKNA